MFSVKKFCHLLAVAPRFVVLLPTGIIIPVLFNIPLVVISVGKAIVKDWSTPTVTISLAVPRIDKLSEFKSTVGVKVLVSPKTLN